MPNLIGVRRNQERQTGHLISLAVLSEVYEYEILLLGHLELGQDTFTFTFTFTHCGKNC
jgi:hypothetical protein